MDIKKKPNILLIITDTQRCDTLKCMGNPHAISPNLDRLAREGILFDNAHTPSPVCMPARTCLLTGVHTPIHCAIENGIDPRDDLTAFPDLLKKQGYINIMVGKTHFGNIPASFDIVHEKVKGKNNNENETAAFIDKTIEEIDRVIAEKRQPFFAFCSILSPHAPLNPPDEWASVYDSIPLPKINYTEGEVERLPIHVKRALGIDDAYVLPDATEIDSKRRLYYGLAAYCDNQIGRLIAYLEQAGLREDTLIIFTSDHGQTYYDHGFDNKHNYYDSSWRIPLIMSMPGTLAEGERRDFAIWNDITATILGAAGTECDFVQGFDLFTPLAEGKPSPRKYAVATLYKSAALATKRWKLEYYFEEEEGRLFDRKQDPLEQYNLYDDKRYRQVRDELLVALLAWRSDLANVEYLVRHTRNGGPVAKRVAMHTKKMKGIDAELRLNRKIERLDALKEQE